MRAKIISHIILLSLGVSLSASALAEGRDRITSLQHREKSTLDTFPLRSLEQEDLSSAVIDGTLDAPAAGDDDEPAYVSDFLPKALESAEDHSDMGRYNIPASIEVRAQPTPIEGRSYSWDYNATQR